MKRGLLTVAALLGVAIGHVRADYVIIVAKLGGTKEPGGQGNQGGAFGLRGGGQFGAGQFGNSGMPIPPGGGFPGGGAGPFPPGGGARGGPPGGGARGGPPGGALPPGGFPGGGMDGGVVGPGGYLGGFAGFQGGGNQQPKEPPISVLAVLETENKFQFHPGGFRNKPAAWAKHKWGESVLWGYNVELHPLKTRDGKALPSVAKRFDQMHADLVKNRKDSTDRLLELADWALEHGLTAQFEKVMNGLSTSAKDHPSVAAYVTVKAALAKKPGDGKALARWKKTLFDRYKVASSDHYALLHKAPSNEAAEVQSRLAQLEQFFTGFYYWHALKGKALPAPRERLVAVLESGTQPDEAFGRLHDEFGAVPVTADSFYSPRHNLIVFCGKRLDLPYVAFEGATSSVWNEIDPDGVLKKEPKLPRGTTYEVYYNAMTLSVLDKALNEDQAVASVTYNGTRQLLNATGLLPGNVAVPRWTHSGMGSFFQTPYGSPWNGYGSPHWRYLFTFNELKEKEKLEKDPLKLLMQVVTDAYFHVGKEEDKEEDKRTAGPVKARATAWALCYFLADRKLDGLHRYFDQLSRLPRDMPLDREVLLDLFARSFDCVDADNKRSDTRLRKLADHWLDVMGTAAVDAAAEPMLKEIYKLQNELAEEQKKRKPKEQPDDGTRPGGGRRPGGFPPGGGRFPPGGGRFPPGGGRRPPGR